MIKLPYEVWTLISLHLSRNDCYNCALVSKDWYTCFLAFLLRDVAVRGQRELDRLYGMLQRSGSGHYVQKLDLDRVKILKNKTQDLQRTCPRVHSLCLGRTLSEISQRPSFLGFATTMIRLLDMFAPQLTSLTFNMSVFPIVQRNSDDGFSFLKNCPNLKYLVLTSTDALTIPMLEEIHSCCPQLEHIELEGGLLRDPIIDDAETIAPANQMREFRLRCSHGWSRYQFWLRFFALKYPNLETLELDNRYGIITLRREDEELRLQEHQCFQLLAHHCRRLRNIRTNHISLDPRFFESLSSYQTHLTTLFLHNVWRHGRKTIIAAIECARNTLHTLSLTIPGNLDKEQLLPLLGTCHRLTNLNIADFDRFEPETFQIDEILDHCKGLQTLEIRQVTVLSYDGKETAQRQHPLTSLKLEEIMFNQNVLDSLSNLCPNLRELSLISCCRVDCTDDMNIEIHLPQHNLRSVTLRDVQHRYFTDRIKYFGLKTQNEEIWCHTSHVKVGRKIVPTAKFFTGNEAELLKEKITDPHSSCSYAKKLRSSGGKALGWSFEELLRGYLSIYCFSLNSLVVNDARLV